VNLFDAINSNDVDAESRPDKFMENDIRSFATIQNAAKNRSISGLLDQIDSRLGKMSGGTPKNGLPVLIELDEVYTRLQNYNGPEDGLLAEKAQFDYIQASIRSNASMLLRQVGGPKQLAALRSQRKPGPDQWWWYLDEHVRQQRRSMMQSLGLTVGGALAVIALLVVLYQAFLAPDAETLARLQHQRMAETSLMAGDTEAALLEIEKALEYDPENIDLLVMQAIGQQVTGDEAASQTSFERLERLFETREGFLLQRALFYNQFEQPEKALMDIEEVIAANPQSALGHYYAGMSNEQLARYTEALEYYDIAFELADEQNQSALAATIRMNMGMLMQAMPGLMTQELGE
jgi:tetratricopeptide (TPR) repeat protein